MAFPALRFSPRTANALGLDVPVLTLQHADEQIE
jgi:hypothetical protein